MITSGCLSQNSDMTRYAPPTAPVRSVTGTPLYVLLLEHFRPVASKNTHFRYWVNCIRRNVQHGIGVIVGLVHFCEDMSHNDYHIWAQVTLTFDLATSRLLCQSLLTWITYPESLNVVRFFSFWDDGEREINGQRGRRTGATHNAASWGWTA